MSMNEAFVTFQGWVGNEVVHRETSGGSVAHFRVGSTPRIRRRNGEWVDGPTSWFSVTCWRALADNVRDSVRKGEPVLVHGRLRTDVWEREDGQTSVTHVVEATSVGHDLNRGSSAFQRSIRPERVESDDEGDSAVREMIHGPVPVDLPQLDSLGRQRAESGRVA
jgi:single-strand DNA-binding protein